MPYSWKYGSLESDREDAWLARRRQYWLPEQVDGWMRRSMHDSMACYRQARGKYVELCTGPHNNNRSRHITKAAESLAVHSNQLFPTSDKHWGPDWVAVVNLLDQSLATPEILRFQSVKANQHNRCGTHGQVNTWGCWTYLQYEGKKKYRDSV